MTFPNKLGYSLMVQLFVREIAKTVGFYGKELNEIDIAVEESVSNVMAYAHDEENPTFDIICEKIPGGLKITVKDKGIPFDAENIRKYELSRNLDELPTKGLGIYLIQKMMNELSFRNLGKEGKETVMIKFLAHPAVEVEEEEIVKDDEAPVPVAGKIDYEVRALQEEEAIEVSRCAYKTHGYTFFDDHIYYPERLVELNRTSAMISAVAVTKDNIFMGHSALLYQYPNDTIAELTFVFVNVEYRGQGALNRLVDFLFNVPKNRKLTGIYDYAVTNHPFTQKSMLKFQINDCGILLATSPSSWKFKGISDDSSQRISVALGFRYMQQPEPHILYAPAHHKEMIAKLFNNLGFNPDIKIASIGTAMPIQSDSIVHTSVNELEGCAEIYVKQSGTDLIREIRRNLRENCLKGVSAINLFLKLDDPYTCQLTEECEKLGFFFAGILPESQIGDALILQYLNNVELDYAKIILVSDIANELLAYIREHDPNIIK